MVYYFKWVILFFNISGRLKNSYINTNGYKTFGILLISIFIVHTTGAQWIGFEIGSLQNVFVYCIMFGSFLAILNDDFRNNGAKIVLHNRK